MKSLLIFVTFVLLLVACKTSEKNIKKGGLDLKQFYGLWKVTAFRFNDGRVMPAEHMGFPRYEFTTEGKRIKTLDTEPAPPPETVDYKVDGDSLRYPSNPKYPAMKIARLSNDTLVLSNDKLSWYLHK